MKVVVIGQSAFGASVFTELFNQGNEILAVYTIPDVNNKEDVLATTAKEKRVPVIKLKVWRAPRAEGGAVLPEVMEEYSKFGAELNVLAFVTQFIPIEVINAPKHGSIVYHPSILPRHRGASAINWTLMEGDKKGGFTIFYGDDGLDTGDIILIEECELDEDETVNSFYNRFLFPNGVKAMAEVVSRIEKGTAARLKQPEEGATYDRIWNIKDLAKINFDNSAQVIHNFIRGNDKVPGAWALVNDQEVTFYSSTLKHSGKFIEKTDLNTESKNGVFLTSEGLVISGNDGKHVLVRQLKLADGRIITASKFLDTDSDDGIELNDEEKVIEQNIKDIWKAILNTEEIEDSTDFFSGGAGSMDVTRLVATVKHKCNIELENDEVYLNTRYKDFIKFSINRRRGGGSDNFEFSSVVLHVNDMDVTLPHQLFIDGNFVDSQSGQVFKTINPTTEEVICEISKGNDVDVDIAVKAAHDAFKNGKWSKMNARDRGSLLFKLADILEENKEELATIESIDSGAVYTLALKTHIGMSIDTFRYFAGCEKKGKTIPINNARPNRNLCLTKREPIGVCGLVVPWNYPFMMLAWKAAACLAAGNTLVLKPAMVTPLTALKFAEYTVKAGFPKGVVNIIPGSGGVVGQAITDHPLIRKVGFTGSTPVGRDIMRSCSINVKKVSLELGGKSALLIFDDCELDRAVKQAMGAVFFNKGENCIAAGRLFVEESIHDEFVKRVIEETKKMKVGDPLDRATDHGPQNHEAHLNSLLNFIQKGVEGGAKLVYGGKRLDRKGYFLEPTIFTHAVDGTFITIEESFGPVMVISTFNKNDIDDVIKRANDTEYGLCAGVFTRDINIALRVSEALEAGTVFVNTYNKTDVAAPFGGFKQSGYGKDLGEDALNEYLKTKTITIEY